MGVWDGSQANIRLGQRTTSQGSSLARKRYQTGSVFLRGKNPVWIGRYREDVIRPDGKVVRKRRSVVLGTSLVGLATDLGST